MYVWESHSDIDYPDHRSLARGMGNEEQRLPLFETSRAKGTLLHRAFAVSVFLGICLVWFYRLVHILHDEDGADGRSWASIGILGAELWFGFYWILSQACKWNIIYRHAFKDRLAQRYEKDLPGVDVFVCTADPVIEPPALVISTVLSVMAYDYPTEKLGVYLSDDGGSELTYYALLEASRFAKRWLPFCKRFKVEPTSPAAYFKSSSKSGGAGGNNDEFRAVKELYEEMENRIDTACKLNRVPDDVRSEHKGFSQWDSYSSKGDHEAIVQVLIDRKDPKAVDDDGNVLPTLVYMAREKRPGFFHNFKAGAMNSLIRVSSVITRGEFILNVDCDMYSNNSDSVREALCFFMDEEKGNEIAFVQFPQLFENATRNDLYGSTLLVISNVEFHGMDGCGGPMYIGSGCFHRRDILCGKKFGDSRDATASMLGDIKEVKDLASCTYEKDTQWGNEVGLKYGVPVEDVMTGLAIQCRGWKSVYHRPDRAAFLGLAPTTLLQTLVQHKRWSEGDLQVALSKHGPAIYGLGRISPGLISAYLTYCMWAPNCIPTLYYSIVPSVYLLRGISLFPEISSPWFVPFAYVMVAAYAYSLAEFVQSGGTVLGWWNEQRMWLYKRTSSYLFAVIDTIVKLLGFSETAFAITAKVADEDVSRRYEAEAMEFGATSPMFTMLSTVASLNLACFIGWGIRLMISATTKGPLGSMFLQGVLCGMLVLINLPLYEGMFVRGDGGKMPTSTTVTSVALAVSVCTCFAFL